MIVSRDYSTKETITDFLMIINEPIVEDAALEWFGEPGYAVGHGPHFA
jgi:hypothetical protein